MLTVISINIYFEYYALRGSQRRIMLILLILFRRKSCSAPPGIVIGDVPAVSLAKGGLTTLPQGQLRRSYTD